MKLTDIQIENLSWDSDFFGYKVGKIDLQKFNYSDINDFNLDYSDFRLIYIFTKSKVDSLQKKLESHGAKFLDRKTEYKLNLSNIQTFADKNQDITFKFLYENDFNEDLNKLAYESGKNSRFKLDQNFKNNEFEKLYDIWLKKSLNKEIAFETIGIFYKSKIVGFITLSKKYDGANIGLVAVSSKYQNQGFGHELLNYSFEYLKNKNYNFLYVTTQGLSEQATNFYEKNDFKLINQIDIFHLWIK
jgi:dTDP-4-amino-4,6-dideoxy-D-galactose acyltransferase